MVNKFVANQQLDITKKSYKKKERFVKQETRELN